MKLKIKPSNGVVNQQTLSRLDYYEENERKTAGGKSRSWVSSREMIRCCQG